MPGRKAQKKTTQRIHRQPKRPTARSRQTTKASGISSANYTHQARIRLPLYFGWEFWAGVGKNRYWREWYIRPFRNHRQYVVGVGVLIGVFVLGGLFLSNKKIQAATYTWVQSAWNGGVSGGTAVHPTNQTGWTAYSAADSTISAGASLSLSPVDQSAVDTSSTDFSAGTQSSTTVNGTGTTAGEQLSISEGSSATFTQYSAIGSYYEYDAATNSMWVSGSSDTLTKYTADGSSTSSLATVSLAVYDSTGVAPITYDSTLGVLWALGRVATNLNLIKINVSTASVISSTTIETDASVVRDIKYDSTNDVLWISYSWTSGARIIKVNKTGTVLQTIATTGTPYNMAVDPGTSSIWYVDGGSTVYKQPQSGAASTAISLGGSYNSTRHIIYESATPAVWATSEQFNASGYHRILTSNNSVTSRTDAPFPVGLAYDSIHDVMWFTDTSQARVYKVNRSTAVAISNYTPSNSAISSQIYYDTNTRSLWFNDNAGGTKRMSFVTYASSGTFTSRIIDTTANVTFGNVSWNAVVPAGTTLTVKVRSSTSATMSGAPAFTGCSALTSGQNATTSGCVTHGERYIQYSVALTTGNTAISPTLQDLTVVYQQYSSGSLTSSPFDTGDATNVLAKVQWTKTGSGTVRFQLRTSADGAAWSSWLGPTGAGDYYLDSLGGENINTTNHDGTNDRYIQYKAYLISADGATTPTVTSVTLMYVVNASPEIQASPTATQNSDGSVTITYAIRDADSLSDTGSEGTLTPSFEYSVDNGSHWSAITSGLPASATTPKAVDTVTPSNYTSYTATWTAKTQLNGTYAAQTKVRVTVNDLQGANNTVSATTSAFVLDVKNPTLGATPVTIDASTIPASVHLSAADDTSLQMCLSLDNSQSNCVAYGATATIGLATDPDTVYVIFVDAKGNTASASAVTPPTPTSLVIRDISNPTTSEYQLFLTWSATTLPVDQFSKYEVYHSTDGVNYSLATTISDKTYNYYLHKNLVADSAHSYKIKTYNARGDVSYYTSVIQGIANGQGGGTDVAPPLVSNVLVSSITTQSAVISWDTDELSNSTVGYSTSSGQFDIESGVATMVNTASGVGPHEVALTGLAPNTTYYARIRSVDPSGNTALDTNGGSGYVFTTLAGPRISGVTTSSIDNTSATVTWHTDIPAPSAVIYSTSPTLATPTTISASADVSDHNVLVTGLTLGTRYYYKVQSGVAIDTNGGQYYYFTTSQDATAPTISSIHASPVTDTKAVITWTTSERASGQVTYGTTSHSYSQSSTVESSLNINHAITLTSLTANTTYYFTITSTDSSGNSSTSDEETFTTMDVLMTAAELEAAIAEYQQAHPIDSVAPVITSPAETHATATSIDITWRTNEAANSFVSFAAPGVDRLVYGNWVYDDEHVISLLNLKPQTRYEYSVISADLSGNSTTSSQYSFTTPAMSVTQLETELQQQVSAIQQQAQGLPGPVIGGKPSVVADSSSVTISWTTDKPASSLVRYAPDHEFLPHQVYTQNVGDPNSYVATHVVKIGNLSENSTYHFQIVSTTQVGQTSSTEDATFKTEKRSFTIDNYSVDTPDTQTAIFRWTTNEQSNASVEVTPYRDNRLTVDESRTVKDTSVSLIHQVNIVDLEPGTKYRVRLFSLTTAKLQAEKILDAFGTSSSGQPPVISHVKIDSALSPGEKVKVQTIVSWTTDIPSTSQVFWRQGVGKTGEVLPEQTTLDTAYTKHHVVVLTTFEPGTVYQLQVQSKNSNGQQATSKSLTTLTPQQQQTVFQVITNTFQQVFGWTNLFSR